MLMGYEKKSPRESASVEIDEPVEAVLADGETTGTADQPDSERTIV
jgi:hypothetical protein